MLHALYLPPFGEFADPHVMADLAVAADEAGWDGIFLWDHMIRPEGDPQQIADTWIVLAAIAASTTRILIGPMITPLARRRPQKVARETVTLDHLSSGRLVLGVGLGVNSGGELERFGETVDEKERADRLDEALELLLELWSGGPVQHDGRYFKASGVRFLPKPVQEPWIPIWGAASGRSQRVAPLQRAARLDGLFPVHAGLDRIEWMLSVVKASRGSLDGFDVAVEVAPDAARTELDALEALGATWTMRSFGVHTPVEDVRALAGQSPSHLR